MPDICPFFIEQYSGICVSCKLHFVPCVSERQKYCLTSNFKLCPVFKTPCEKLIFVQNEDQSFGYVATADLDKMIFAGKIQKFLRSNGWVVIGCNAVRVKQLTYSSAERRKKTQKKD
jgi:hypothetical protein